MKIPKIKALIVDDEADSRELLMQLLAPFADKLTVVGMAENAQHAIKLIEQTKPNMLFLDVQMPGKNGFQLLDQLENIDFEVVFVTSYEQYALSAIKFNAMDYLLKPIDKSELKLSVEKAHLRINSRSTNHPQIVSLLKNLQLPQKIAVHVNDIVQLIELVDIVYIEGQGNYSRIFVQNGQEFIIPRLLKDFEDYFGSTSLLVRLNRSILVNSRQIASYSKGEPCLVSLKNGKSFEVSRRKKQEIIGEIVIKLG